MKKLTRGKYTRVALATMFLFPSLYAVSFYLRPSGNHDHNNLAPNPLLAVDGPSHRADKARAWATTHEPFSGFLKSVDQGWVVVLLAAFGLAQLGEDFEVWQFLQNRRLPPNPEFLSWPRSKRSNSAWDRAIPFVGRNAQLAELYQWIDSETQNDVTADGIYGLRGVGKTRLAVEWMSSLRMNAFERWYVTSTNFIWRLISSHKTVWIPKHRWHVGKLSEHIPPDWKPTRPTAILVDYIENPKLFWDSWDTLSQTEPDFPVRILFESNVDFDQMVEGRPPHKVDKLRSHLRGFSPRLENKLHFEVSNVPKPQPVLIPNKGSDLSPPPSLSPRSNIDQTISSFLFRSLPPLSRHDAIESILTAAISRKGRLSLVAMKTWNSVLPRAWRPSTLSEASRTGRVTHVFKIAKGRPQYLVRLAGIRDLVPHKYVVAREDAEWLVERVMEALPEEGLKVLLLASLGGNNHIRSEVRLALSPGAGDRRRLSRLFTASESDLDLLLYAPTIADEEVAKRALMLALSRLQQADLHDVADKLFNSNNFPIVEDFQRNLRNMLIEVNEDDEENGKKGLTPLAKIAVSLLLCGHGLESRVAEAAKQCIGKNQRRRYNLPEHISPTSASGRRYINQEFESLKALGLLIAAAVRVKTPYGRAGALAFAKTLARIAESFLEKTDDPEDRKALIETFAGLTPFLGPELRLITKSDHWLSSPHLITLFRILIDRDDEIETFTDSWLFDVLR